MRPSCIFRVRLTAMNELEREMELAERAERRDDLIQRRQLLQTQRQADRRQKAPARKVGLHDAAVSSHIRSGVSTYFTGS